MSPRQLGAAEQDPEQRASDTDDERSPDRKTLSAQGDASIRRIAGRPEIGGEPGQYTYRDVNGTAFILGKDDASAISPNDVLQGQVGDCWFMAAIIAIAAVDPRALERLIKPLGNGKYEVTIYTRDAHGKKITNKVTVDDDFPTFAQTESGYDRQTGQLVTFEKGTPAYVHGGDTDQRGRREIWPLLIEKAAAMVRVPGHATYDAMQAGNGKEGLDMLLPDERWPENLDVIGTGTSPTGRMIPAYMDTDELAMRLMMHNLAHRPMSTGGARREYCDGKPIMTNHVYAIVGVDFAGRTVTLQDPNGVTSGVFKIEEYKQCFGYLSVGEAIRIQ